MVSSRSSGTASTPSFAPLANPAWATRVGSEKRVFLSEAARPTIPARTGGDGSRLLTVSYARCKRSVIDADFALGRDAGRRPALL